MPANIDSMAYTGEVPWHRCGTRVDHPMTAREAITAGGLDWRVTKEPIYCGQQRDVLIKDRFVMRRLDRLDRPDGGQLGVVGRDYEPLQNEEAFSFMDPVVGEGSALFHTVGALDGGRRVWLLAKLPGEIRITVNDVTEKYLLLSSSHDGTSAVRILFTPIRVVCQNTLNIALRDARGLSIRHHSDVHERVKQAHKLLGIVNTTYDRAAESMQAMAKVQINSDRLKAYFESVMPVSTDNDQLRAKVLERHHRLEELFTEGIGNSLPGVRGTVWAAYNGIVQWVDRESFTRRLKEPVKSTWFGQGRQLKERAFTQAERMLATSNN